LRRDLVQRFCAALGATHRDTALDCGDDHDRDAVSVHIGCAVVT